MCEALGGEQGEITFYNTEVVIQTKSTLSSNCTPMMIVFKADILSDINWEKSLSLHFLSAWSFMTIID